MDEIARRRTRRRFERNAKNKKRLITDLNRNILGQIIPDFADYLRSPEAPQPLPELEYVVRNVEAEELALIALAALLHHIDHDWKDRDDDDDDAPGLKGYRKRQGARTRACLAMGRDLRDQLEMKNLLERCPAAYKHVTAAKNKRQALWRFRRLDWAEADIARAGNFLWNARRSWISSISTKGGFRESRPIIRRTLIGSARI